VSKEKRGEKHSLFDQHINLLPQALHFRNSNRGNLEVLEKSTSRQQLLFCGWEEAETTGTQPCPTLLV
jgi:hypothetical protein